MLDWPAAMWCCDRSIPRSNQACYIPLYRFHQAFKRWSLIFSGWLAWKAQKPAHVWFWWPDWAKIPFPCEKNLQIVPRNQCSPTLRKPHHNMDLRRWPWHFSLEAWTARSSPNCCLVREIILLGIIWPFSQSVPGQSLAWRCCSAVTTGTYNFLTIVNQLIWLYLADQSQLSLWGIWERIPSRWSVHALCHTPNSSG